MVLEFYLNKTVMKPADHSPLYVSLDSYLTQFPSCRALFPGTATSAGPSPSPPSKCGSSSLNPSVFHLTGGSWYQELSGSPLPPSLLSPPMLSCPCVLQTTKGNSESSSFQFWVSPRRPGPNTAEHSGQWLRPFPGQASGFFVCLDIFVIKCWKIQPHQWPG